MKPESFKGLLCHVPTSVAVGNFDGVHKGHQALVKKAKEFAKKDGLLCIALTFHPHPLKVFGREKRLIITHLEEKVRLLKAYGADRVYVLKFDSELSNMAPETFVEEVLHKRLNCKALVVGQNFKFGRERSGNVETLKRLSTRYGFTFFAHPQVLVDGVPVSSTRVRRLVREGKVEEAARLLGRPYKVEGEVVKGKGRGKGLGFPTANVEPFNEVIPKNGVYAALVDLDSSLHKAVVNIGLKPTFGEEDYTIEAHILDFERDLYGKRVGIHFAFRLRAEKKFDNIEQLREAIGKDVERGRELLQWECILRDRFLCG